MPGSNMMWADGAVQWRSIPDAYRLVPMALGSVCGRKIGRKIEKVAATTDSTSIGTYNFVHLDPETMHRLVIRVTKPSSKN